MIQPLNRTRKDKARSILRAAHQILQTHDPRTIMRLCQEIKSTATVLFLTAEASTKDGVVPMEEPIGREGMEGL